MDESSMTIGFIFWLLMLIGAILTVWSGWPYNGNYRPFSGLFFIFVLMFLLGWKVFGFVVQG
jgi:hypothetical protein